jgi:hypothetical protein
MRNWRRFLCLWLIAVALPLQGALAGSLRLCGPLHGTVAATAATAPGHDRDAAPAVHSAHGHHGAAMAAAVGDAPTSPDAGGKHCTYCGACCPAALPPPAMAGVPADIVPAAVRPARGWLAALRFVTDGPERPPRSPLA